MRLRVGSHWTSRWNGPIETWFWKIHSKSSQQPGCLAASPTLQLCPPSSSSWIYPGGQDIIPLLKRGFGIIIISSEAKKASNSNRCEIWDRSSIACWWRNSIAVQLEREHDQFMQPYRNRGLEGARFLSEWVLTQSCIVFELLLHSLRWSWNVESFEEPLLKLFVRRRLQPHIS